MAINKPILDPVASKGKTVQQYTDLNAATTATSGDQTLINAPGAGFRLVIADLLIQNESSTETTVIVKGGSTAKRRAKLAANAALSLNFEEDNEWRLAENAALVLNLSGTNSHGYSGRYFIEPV